MSKKRTRKKSNPQSNTNLHLLPVNIEYDKLAEAFINAQERHKEKSEEKRSNKTDFLKVLWLIIRGKNDTKDRMTVGLMSIPLIMLFKLLSFVGICSIPIGLYEIVKQGIAMTWTTGWNIVVNIIVIIFLVYALIIIFIFSVLVWGASNEIERSEDKHFVAAVFSGIVSLVALVVSLIALKG